MKNVIIFLFLATIIGCGSSKKSSEIESSKYNVTKLDSINSYYLIYAKRNDSLFKIISKKDSFNNCKKIEQGRKYQFKLSSMRENAPTIGGIKISPVNYIDIKCFQFDEATKICKEEGIYDLYFAGNLKGLCFTN